jgi:hypothetical protein
MLRTFLLIMMIVIMGCDLNRPSTGAVSVLGSDKTVTRIGEIAISDVFPKNPIVAVNGSIRLTAIVVDPGGSYLQSTQALPVSVHWSSSDPSVASVNSSGTIFGKKEGITTITLYATYSGATTKEHTQTIQVVNLTNDVAEVYLSPDRAYIDINAERIFSLTAVDYSGAQTSINPGQVSFVLSDTNVASITPDVIDANDTKKVTVTGLAKGYVFITPIYSISNEQNSTTVNITGTPLVVQVKDRAESSKPIDNTVDAGRYLSMAVNDIAGKKNIHVLHHDVSDNRLHYSLFNGSWKNETILTGGGEGAKIVLSPFNTNKNLPIAMFLENGIPKIWFQTAPEGSSSFTGWVDTHIQAPITSETLFEDNISLTQYSRFMDMSVFKYDLNTSLNILYYEQKLKRIHVASSTMNQDAWFDWEKDHLTLDLDTGFDLESLSLAHNHQYGLTRFAYIVKESNSSNNDGGVYYVSKGSEGLKPERIINTDGDEKSIVLKLDSNNVPSVIWRSGKDIVYATRVLISGKFTWSTKVLPLDPKPNLISSLDLAFDAYNSPKITFTTDGKIRYARRVDAPNGQDVWIIENPEDSGAATQGEYVSLAIDDANRGHLVYTSPTDKWFTYWAEPSFFDYRVYPNAQNINADVVIRN